MERTRAILRTHAHAVVFLPLEVVVDTTVSKEVPPDVTAASAWLKNRCPDKWRDKPQDNDNEVFRRLDKIIGELDAEADR